MKEVGDTAKNVYRLKRVALFTDSTVRNLPSFELVTKSLRENGVDFLVYDQTVVEPTDSSFLSAARFASEAKVDGFISLGGGSVIDTCKAANLYSSAPPPPQSYSKRYDEDFLLYYVNPPIGKGASPDNLLLPHICCPTTSGTGSENTGLAIFDFVRLNAKTGIANRAIRPSIAIIDPTVTHTLPPAVCAASGFDVLSHAVESYTARPHYVRSQASKPHLRPMSQGANKWADIGCLEALKVLGECLERAVNDEGDTEAREGMMWASTLAGIAFGNVGCHLPHGMSYPVSGMIETAHSSGKHSFEGYPTGQRIIPHGFSVIVNSPSVFRFTAKACPDRHTRAAKALGADVRGVVDANDAGEVLASRIIELMRGTRLAPNGLSDVGYSTEHLSQLVNGAFLQRRLLDNAPLQVTPSDLTTIYQQAFSYW